MLEELSAGVRSGAIDPVDVVKEYLHGFYRVEGNREQLTTDARLCASALAYSGKCQGDFYNNGADYIVVGRPIRDAADPRAAAEAIQQTIARSFAGARA